MLNRRRCLFALCGLMLMATAPLSAPAQSNSKEIMALPAADLVALLQKPDAGEFEKAKACQRLAVVGTKDAIPALVALLPDEKLNFYARFGLEGIPDPAVDDALRDAAGRLTGRQQVGVIDSIGQRRDAKSVELLKGLLTNSDAIVASAAAGALGRIGTTDAAAVLKAGLSQPMPLRNAVADATLACAEQLAITGKKEESLALFSALGQADVPKHVKTAAVVGQLRVLQAEGRDLLIAQLVQEDPSLFNVGLAAARNLAGTGVTAAVLEIMEKLSPQRKSLVLLALGDRKEELPLEKYLAAAKNDAPEVREAAVIVLSKRGDVSALPVLLEAALGEGSVAVAAREGLKGLPGSEVDAAIVAKLSDANGAAKVVLFEIAGDRRIAAAHPLARQAITSSEEPVRLAAMAALGKLVELNNLDLLMGRAFAAADSADRKAAQEAITVAALRLADREAVTTKLTAAMRDLTDENKVFVLKILGRMAGAKALDAVYAAARSETEDLKDAATEILGEWPNPEAADALLDIAKSDKEAKYQIRAIRGYIRIARQLQLPEDKRLAMFHTAMGVAKRDDDKCIALDILSRIPSVSTLQMAVSYLDNPALKDDAGGAAVKIAAKVISENAAAVADAMTKVVKARIKGQPGNKARQLLEQAQANAT